MIYNKYNRWLLKDKGKVKIEIRKHLDLVLKVQDTFVLYKKENVIFITDDVSEMLKYVFKDKKQTDYELFMFLEFLKVFHKDSCKWKSANKIKVLKYNNTIRLTKPHSSYRKLLDHPEILLHNRREKLKTILNKK